MLTQLHEKERKKLDRSRMTRVEKLVNNDDLQDYKAYGTDIYTRAVPGIHSTVNPAMAKKVLTMFNKK
jgi:hypothetical protein